MLKLILITLLLFSISVQASSISIQSNFISIADIHFNPLYSCKYSENHCLIIDQLQKNSYKKWDSIFSKDINHEFSNYNEDTNFFLLDSTLKRVKKLNQQQKTNFVLLLGDFYAHKLREKYIAYSGDKSYTGFENFAKKTMQFLAEKIGNTFPDNDVYITIGNNDSYTGSYNVVPKGIFLKNMTEIWAPLIKNKLQRKQFLHSFPVAGYYSITIPAQSKNKLIVLNTVLFSNHPGNVNTVLAASAQLDWINKQLQNAYTSNKKVLLAFHIPFGIDVHATLYNKNKNVMNEFWHRDDNQELIKYINKFNKSIRAILTAHIHMDAFKVINEKNSSIPILFTPSVSPIFSNNPGYKRVYYDKKSLRITNFTTVFYPLNQIKPHWNIEYNFNQIYQSNCHNCAIINGISSLHFKNKLAQDYIRYYPVSSTTNDIKPNNWIYYWCSIYHQSLNSYQNCIKSTLP